MCLILAAVDAHPAYRLIIAANRDEFYDRPTLPAAFWKEPPGLLAGRDLRGGGTWMGITREGRMAAITNYRDPASNRKSAPSRGRLVTGFLAGEDEPGIYIARLMPEAARYNGFNLLAGDRKDLYWYSNRGEGIRRLGPGIHGLSNRLLDTPWPKVTRAKKMFRHVLSAGDDVDPEALFRLLEDRMRPADKDLPDTGMGLELERILSPIFITSPAYGTRSSSILLMDREGDVTFLERTFDRDPDHPSTRDFRFRIA